MNFVKNLRNNQSGQALSEYLILMILVGVGAIAATTSIGKTSIKKLELINRNLDDKVTLEATRGGN